MKKVEGRNLKTHQARSCIFKDFLYIFNTTSKTGVLIRFPPFCQQRFIPPFSPARPRAGILLATEMSLLLQLSGL